MNDIDRFMEKVIDNGKCWMWIGTKNDHGYGVFSIGRKSISAHRFSYQYFNGELINGMEIDHTCKNRSCVNPAHLEQVTRKENIRRSHKTHCINGHEFTPKNTYTDPRGFRQCKTCEKIRRTTESYRASRRIK